MDDAWGFRKAIGIPSHTTLETNVYITVPTFDATDTSKFQADCGDLRFTKQNGEQLPYYVVDCDATANIHVLFDTLPAGASTYYLYYGNPSAQNGFSSADFATAATGLGTQTLASEEKSAGPVAFWKFDEGYGTSANNSTSVTGINGTLSGSPLPTWKTEDQCISGKCLYFDGTSGYTDVNSSTNLNFGTNDFTVEFWINYKGPMTINKELGILGKTSSQASTAGFMLEASTYGRDGSSYTIISSVTNSTWGTGNLEDSSKIVLYPNKWYHVTSIRSGTTWSTYIDGKFVTSATKAGIGANVDNSNHFVIGNEYVGSPYRAVMILDEPKIYPYARSAAQIKSDYNSQGTVKGSSVQIGSKNPRESFSQGLVGYWKMDESSWTNDCTATSVTDSSGNGNNGKACPASTGPTGGAAGKFGNGGSFDGVNDQVTIGTSAFTTGATTITMWVKPTVSQEKGIGDLLVGGSGLILYERTIDAGTERAMMGFRGNPEISTPANAIIVGAWNFLTFVYNGGAKNSLSSFAIYVNGINQTSLTASGTIGGSTTNNVIGSDQSSAFFNGQIDETRIYNRALSPKEVRDLYNWAPGPLAYYNFDEGSGVNTYDASSNDNIGTATNANIVNGKFGKARTFTGASNSKVEASVTNLPLDNNAKTISAWFKTSDTTARHRSIAAYGTGVSGKPIFLLDVNASNKLYTESGSGADAISSLTSVNDNKWHFGSITHDGITLKLYLDGVLQGSSNCTLATATSNFGIGEMIWDTSLNFIGDIDEVRLYNYARSSKQIVEDMNAGHPAPGSPVGSQVGYWKMDEGYGDTANNSGSVGSAINGDLAGSCPGAATCPTWSNSGKFGKALSFDGSDYLQVPDNSSLDLGLDQAITISAWIKTNITTAQRIIAKYQASGAGGYSLMLNNGPYLRIVTNNGSGTTYQAVESTILPQNSWQFVTGVINPGQPLKLYRNGVEVSYSAQQIYVSEDNSNADSLKIGTIETADSAFWNGFIDEVKIYNSALTEDEIKLDYNHGSAMVLGSTSTTSAGVPDNSSTGEYCVPGSSDSCSAPVDEWKFDEKTGTNAYDTSGNGNTGTVTNATWALGKAGAALNFDGSGDYVVSTTNPSTSQVFTTSYWFKTPTPSTNMYLLDRGGNVHWFELLSSKLRSGTSAANYSDSTMTIQANTWYHAAMTYDGTTIKQYINGVQQFSIAGGNVTPSGLQLARYYNGSTYFTGQIDHVRIYNYARTPAQIAWDYNRGGPVGHWKFDECQGGTANDASGNGNNGTITIGATGSQTSPGTCTDGFSTSAWYNGRTGKYNSSLNFDGTDDQATVSSPSNLPSGASAFTSSVWIRPSNNGNNLYILKWGVSASGTMNALIWYGATSSVSQAFYANDLGTAANSVLVNTWTHVVATYDGTTRKIYLNGNLSISDTPTAPNVTANQSLYFGSVGGGAYFPGQIDDVRIYNYALTANQIKTLFNNGSVNFGPSTGSP